VKLVHLVGFITKKFVTIHDHTNVKKTALSSGLNTQEPLQIHWPEMAFEKQTSPNVSLRLVRSYSIRHIQFVTLKCQIMSVTILHSNNSHHRMD